MTAIDPDYAKKIYEAIETIRDFLPEAASLGEIVAPEFAPEIMAGEAILGKIFEVVAVLETHETKVDAGLALRAKTEQAWKDALQKDPR